MSFPTIASSLVDTSALFKVVWVAALGGVGVSVAFSLLVLGSTRAGEARRAGRAVPAVAYTTLAVLGLVASLWAVWRGYLFVVEK